VRAVGTTTPVVSVALFASPNLGDHVRTTRAVAANRLALQQRLARPVFCNRCITWRV
jgi:hypothetical protein